MGSTKYEGYNWLQIQRQRRNALLYVAARFMMVRIDTCAKRRAASAKQQASFKLGPSIKLQATSLKLQAASNKFLNRAAWIKYRGARSVGLN